MILKDLHNSAWLKYGQTQSYDDSKKVTDMILLIKNAC